MNFINNIKSDKIIFKNSVSNSEIYIDGDIGESLFTDGYTFKDFKNDVSQIKSDTIVVNISSYGGDLFEALNIYDFIKNLNKKVITNVIGSSASAATIISMAGDERYITKNSRYLIHKPIVGLQGNSDNFRKVLSELEELDKQLIDIYVEKTNLNEDEILSLMIEEKFITAKEAIEYGFIDGYVKSKDVKLDKINSKMDKKELTKILGIDSEDKITETIQNLITVKNEGNKDKEELEAKIAELEAKLAENVDENEEVVEPNEDEKFTEEYIKELEAENAELKTRIEELEAQMVDGAEDKANEVNNFVDSLVKDGKIKAASKEHFFNLATDNGVEFVTNILNGIETKETTKLSKMIGDEPTFKNKADILNAYKAGKINAVEYTNLLNQF